MPFGGRTYGIHSEPVLSVSDIPCLVLGPFRIHSLSHSTNALTCLISGWLRCPGGGNGTPLQYLCLENPMDRGA